MYKFLIMWALPILAAAQQQNLNPNPDPRFNPATSAGTLGPFIIPQQPAPGATGGPPRGSVDARTIQAMQLAASNWATDTGIVSLFQNNGPITADPDQFRGIADGAFKAEVDELTQKAVLDQVIGNDPRVSLANLTLTNGVFQSVVDNLQIMSIQGQSRMSLISAINSVRCTQILPAIDTYLIVAAEYIGDNAQQRRAVRPNACAQILAASGSIAFAKLPGTPAGTPPGLGDGNIAGVPGACGQGNSIQFAANSTLGATLNSTVPSTQTPKPLGQVTTPQLGLPGFPGSKQSPTSGSKQNPNSGSKQTPPSGSKQVVNPGSKQVAKGACAAQKVAPRSPLPWGNGGSLHGQYGKFRQA